MNARTAYNSARITVWSARHLMDTAEVAALASLGPEVSDAQHDDAVNFLTAAYVAYDAARAALTLAEAAMDATIAWDRDEADECEVGTVGCSIAHSRCQNECDSW